MFKSQGFAYAAMTIPVIGWMYVGIGAFLPIENAWLAGAWWVILAASAGLHPLQLIVALPAARMAGIGTARAAFMTIVFGATWWKPVRDGINRGKGGVDRNRRIQ